MEKKELIKKINIDFSRKDKLVKNLKDILKICDKDNLNDFYYTILKEENDLSEQKLIGKLYDLLTDEEIIHMLLNTLTENEYNVLVKIINNNGDLQDDYVNYNDYCYLKNFGIVHMFNCNDHIHFIIPDEIMDVFKGINFEIYPNKVAQNSKLVKLAYSMINLYGVVPIDVYCNACIKYFGYEETNMINLCCILIPERVNSIRGIETDCDVYLIKEAYLEDSNKIFIDKVITRIEDSFYCIDYKEIDLDELLKYEIMGYYENNSEVLTLKKYLKKIGLNDHDIDFLIETIVETFRVDYEEGIIILSALFTDYNLNITEDNIDEVMGYINNIVFNIPLWVNKGWTNKEIILGKCYE